MCRGQRLSLSSLLHSSVRRRRPATVNFFSRVQAKKIESIKTHFSFLFPRTRVQWAQTEESGRKPAGHESECCDCDCRPLIQHPSSLLLFLGHCYSRLRQSRWLAGWLVDWLVGEFIQHINRQYNFYHHHHHHWHTIVLGSTAHRTHERRQPNKPSNVTGSSALQERKKRLHSKRHRRAAAGCVG